VQSRFLRRAALRAALAVGVGSVAALPLRRRPGLRRAVAAGSIIIGAGLEVPAVGVASLGAGLAMLRRRPRPTPGVATAGVVLGGLAAAATTRWWPVAPRIPAEVQRTPTPVDIDAVADGSGVVFVVNPSSGPAYRSNPADDLREKLPDATVLELGEDLDLDDALAKARKEAKVIGVAGGDGTVNAAAGAAVEAGLPLLVVPGGTLNHFARDLGVTGVDDAAEALGQGHAVGVDLGVIAGEPFLNTASFGGYSELVDARERLEATIGKWPALVVALVTVLRRSVPCEVELDGEPHRVWMVFVGNCLYQPSGFAPAWRERLDDGLLDIRLVDGDEPHARLRLLAAVLTGQLARSRVYTTYTAERLHVRSLNGPMRLARDGETFDGPAEFDIAKHPDRLTVFAPRP
jgi:diacylglycerol kinase family enzyme